MVKYWIYYEDGSYELIKCPECAIEDVKHIHEPGQYDELVCNQCASRFHLEERKDGIVKILSQDEVDEISKIASEESVKAQKEYEERARKLREENRE
jgi:hypothetical protein